MKIQNIIKILWKIKFGSKLLKPREAPTATSPREPLEATGQRGDRVGPPLPDAIAAPAPSMARSHCPSPSRLVLRAISRRAWVEAPLILTLSIFHSLTFTCSITCKNIFHKAQVQENYTEKSYIHHHQAKLMGCLICFSLT